MKVFKEGDKVRRINTGLIGMPLGTIWTVDVVLDDGSFTLRGSKRVINTMMNFELVDEDDTHNILIAAVEFG